MRALATFALQSPSLIEMVAAPLSALHWAALALAVALTLAGLALIVFGVVQQLCAQAGEPHVDVTVVPILGRPAPTSVAGQGTGGPAVTWT
jgi:hypothetical protein